jgi:hypothetical protein
MATKKHAKLTKKPKKPAKLSKVMNLQVTPLRWR